jgi:hypothetical protein
MPCIFYFVFVVLFNISAISVLFSFLDSVSKTLVALVLLGRLQ